MRFKNQLPMKARQILMKAAEHYPDDTEKHRQWRIEQAHENVRRLFPEYFQQRGIHDLQGSS